MPLDEGILDGIVQMAQTAAGPMMVRLLGPAQWLFIALLTIDLSWDIAGWALAGTLDLNRFVRKILIAAICWTLLIGAPYWLPQLIEGFGVIGELATGGVEGLSPSALLGQGVSLFLSMYDSLGNVLSVFVPGSSGLIRGGLSFSILIAYALAAGQLTRILVEVAIVLAGFFWVLAFAAFTKTWSLANGYLVYLFHLGIKIAACYILVAIGGDLGAIWDEQLDEASLFQIVLGPGEYISMVVAAGVWAGLVVLLPDTIASRLTAGFNLAPRREAAR